MRHLSSLKATRYPTAQNFLVEMRDAWVRPGTMCALVTWCGSHGILRLQVCVNWIVPSLGNVLVIGLAAFILFTTGTPLTGKCPLAPGSEMVWCTCLTKLFVATSLNWILFCLYNACSALCLVGVMMDVGWMGLIVIWTKGGLVLCCSVRSLLLLEHYTVLSSS